MASAEIDYGTDDKDDDGLLDVGALCRSVNYDPETGMFIWVAGGPRRVVGARAGGFDAKGYRRIMVDGVRYDEHRLAWFISHGKWPAELIDHKNGNPADNRLCNLREATRSENAMNKKRHASGRSGLKGASFHKDTGKWQSQIMKNGKKLFLGIFDTPEEAHVAYVAAAEREFGAFARAS